MRVLIIIVSGKFINYLVGKTMAACLGAGKRAKVRPSVVNTIKPSGTLQLVQCNLQVDQVDSVQFTGQYKHNLM